MNAAFRSTRGSAIGVFCAVLGSAEFASATPYLIGTGVIPATAVDGSGLTRVLEDGVTPENRVGGFGSALAYTGNGTRYLATPDRGPADGTTTYADRYYQIDIQVDPLAHTVTPSIVATQLLRNELGQQFTGSSAGFDATNSPASTRLDPEGVRAGANGTLWISDEYGPFVYQFDASGQRLGSFPVPAKFLIQNPSAVGANELPPGNTSGRQANRGMEGLAISPDGTRLLGIMQSPLIQDNALSPTNSRIGENVRMLEMDLASASTREFVYRLSSRANGISEILAINDTQSLVLERDGNAGAAAAFKRIYIADTASASDISGVAALPQRATDPLPPGVTAVSKTLLIDLLDPAFGLAGASFPEKPEGLAFGPDLANGDHLLLVSSDNDFLSTQDSKFFAFGIPAADLPGFIPQRFTSTIPEPGTALLLGVGLMSLQRLRRQI